MDFVELIKDLHFDATVIVRCVRWYLTYTLSSRDLREMMAERGVDRAHTMILRWVQRYLPEVEKRRHTYGRPVGSSWRVDETEIKITGN
jgi:transposase-like protein